MKRFITSYIIKVRSRQFTLITRICRTVTFFYAKVGNFDSEITNGREAYVETCHNLQQQEGHRPLTGQRAANFMRDLQAT